MKGIHKRCQKTLKKTLPFLRSRLKERILGISVIGSSTCSDWEEGSDIDLVILEERPIDYLTFNRLEEELKPSIDVRVQLIPIELDYLYNYHLKNRTTMAHSIRRGRILFDGDGYFKPFLALTDHDLPTREWIKAYFLKFVNVHGFALTYIEKKEAWHKKCAIDSLGEYNNEVCRAIVNYSILYLELNGFIPTTKRQIIRGLKKEEIPWAVLKDVERSMSIRREDRLLRADELESMCTCALYLKDTLQSLLLIPEEQLEKHFSFF